MPPSQGHAFICTFLCIIISCGAIDQKTPVPTQSHWGAQALQKQTLARAPPLPPPEQAALWDTTMDGACWASAALRQSKVSKLHASLLGWRLNVFLAACVRRGRIGRCACLGRGVRAGVQGRERCSITIPHAQWPSSRIPSRRIPNTHPQGWPMVVQTP